LFKGLEKRLSEKKSIDEIAKELCPGISKGRKKVVKIIKMSMGGQYLLDNHEWLGYRVDRIRNPKGTCTYKNKPKKSEMLCKPSLSTRKPNYIEYNKWIDSLTDAAIILVNLDREIVSTTEECNCLKVNELKKRILELRELIKNDSGKKGECGNLENSIIEIEKEKEIIIEEDKRKKRGRRPKRSTLELKRKIFEKAKEQIELLGRVNGARIARELGRNTSNVCIHLKKMDSELDELIKKWIDERDKKMVNVKTKSDVE
jgi:hypothetical protein